MSANSASTGTIDGWIWRSANKTPDKVAIIFGDETITYSQFAVAIEQKAQSLRQAGVGRGDRVAWYGLNHWHVFVLLFACARLGAIFVPLNWRLAPPEVAAVVSNCEPVLVFYDDHFADDAKALSGVTALRSEDQTAPKGVDDGRSALCDNACAKDPLLLVYTSGSTGQPKGAVLTQEALIANAAMSVHCHAMTPDDVVLNVLPLFHVGGLNILPTPAFSIGATVELHERFDPGEACQALQRVTLAITVPTVLQAIMESASWETANFSNLRALSIGSTDVPLALIDAVEARGFPLAQIYGATETGPFAIYQTVGEARQTRGSIGRAGSQCAIRLVKEGKDVAVGEAGEIWVKGDNVLKGYWQDEALTKRSITNGWFRTGDVALCDEHGQYWFTDRIKNIIISGGENIFPTEIERLLREVEGVEEVSVVGRPHEKWGAIPVAVVVANRALTTLDILGPLEGQLARYKHPREVVFVDSLPRNATGKVIVSEVVALIG